MKQKTLLISISILSYLFSSSQDLEISKRTNLDGYGNYHPQIEIANDNNPIILWTNNLDKNVYIAKYNGSNFNTPVQLNPTGYDVQSYNWSGADLSIWNNNIYVTFRSAGYETGHCYLVKSNDNGSTFGDTVRIDNLSSGYAQYPDIAVYNDTIFATFMAHDAGGINPQYVVSRSVDGGATFQSEVVAGELVGNEACDCCQPEIVANNKYVIVFFRNNASNIRDIKAVISYDRGATFSNWVSVDDHLWNIMSCPSTGPDARISNDKILTTYRSNENNSFGVFLNEYNLASDQSIETLKLSSNLTNPNYPQIAQYGNNIGIVFEAFSNSTDIMFLHSANGVSGIDTSNIINLTDTFGVQSKPDISFDGNNFHVVYANGSNLTYNQISSNTSNIVESARKNITIFPNPTPESFYILEGKEHIGNRFKVINMEGKIVSSGIIYTENEQINLQSLPSGAYQLIIQNKLDSKSIPIIKN